MSFTVSLNPIEVLQNLVTAVFLGETISGAVTGAIETFGMEVGDMRTVRDVTFLFEPAEIASVHDYELARTVESWHHIETLTKTAVSFLSLTNGFTEFHRSIEFVENVHSLMN